MSLIANGDFPVRGVWRDCGEGRMVFLWESDQLVERAQDISTLEESIDCLSSRMRMLLVCLSSSRGQRRHWMG